MSPSRGSCSRAAVSRDAEHAFKSECTPTRQELASPASSEDAVPLTVSDDAAPALSTHDASPPPGDAALLPVLDDAISLPASKDASSAFASKDAASALPLKDATPSPVSDDAAPEEQVTVAAVGEHSANGTEHRRRRHHYFRSPLHVFRRLFSRRILVTIETASGEQICKRRFRRSSDCLDMTHAAYRYDEKNLLTPQVPVGDDGGIAAFDSPHAITGGFTFMGPGQTLRRVTPFGEREATIRVVSHADFFRTRCRQLPEAERVASERRAKRFGNEVKLEPYKYDEKQPMDFITQWRPYGHCVGFFRPSAESLSQAPLSKRPGYEERKWISFEVLPVKFYAGIKYDFWSTDDLPTENLYHGHHPSLSIKDFEEAAIKATRGRYKLYESNCQTTLLSMYEEMGLADYASKFDNMLLRKGIQTREKTERCRGEHFSVEPFPDKGCLAYCEPEALVVCCGKG